MTDARPALAIGHAELAVHELERSADFYLALGLREIEPLAENHIVCELELRGGTHLVLVLDPTAHTNNRPAPFDLMTDDIDDLHNRMSARGIAVSNVTDDGHRQFTFRDPDGYVVTVNDTHVDPGRVV